MVPGMPPLRMWLGGLSGFAMPRKQVEGETQAMKHAKGSPPDVLSRLLKSRRELKQMLTDVQSCNDNNPNFKKEPMDVGRYLVRLKKCDEIIAKVRSVVAIGESRLPDGILDPLCEPF